MDTKILEYILAVAEEQSLTKAADRFYLSHAALSKHIRKIEADLGTPLFVRSSGGMRLTSAGLVFVEDARMILHLEHKLGQRLESMKSQQNHVIRIMVDLPFYNLMIRQVLPRFQEIYPADTIEVTQCDASKARDALIHGAAELGVFVSAAARVPELVCTTIAEDDLHILFPPDYKGKTDQEGLLHAIRQGMYFIGYPAGTTMNEIIRSSLGLPFSESEHKLEGYSSMILEYIANRNACGVLPGAYLEKARNAGLVMGETICHIHHIVAYGSHTDWSGAAKSLSQMIFLSQKLHSH